MVVFVPVALGMPPVFVFVPPAVIFIPATLAGLVQFTALMVCLSAVASMLFDGLVKFMISVSDAALAVVVIFSMKPWDCGEEQGCCQYGS